MKTTASIVTQKPAVGLSYPAKQVISRYSNNAQQLFDMHADKSPATIVVVKPEASIPIH